VYYYFHFLRNIKRILHCFIIHHTSHSQSHC